MIWFLIIAYTVVGLSVAQSIYDERTDEYCLAYTPVLAYAMFWVASPITVFVLAYMIIDDIID